MVNGEKRIEKRVKRKEKNYWKLVAGYW